MSQLEYTADTARTDPGVRKESYLQWRQRLADQQDDLRNLGEADPEPTLSSEWSPEALFQTDAGSTAPVDGAPAEVAQAEVAQAETQAPAPDGGWDRTEVDALLRQFRATAGSPRKAVRTARAESGPTLVPELDDHTVRYFDGTRVVRSSKVDTTRNSASTD